MLLQVIPCQISAERMLSSAPWQGHPVPQACCPARLVDIAPNVLSTLHMMCVTWTSEWTASGDGSQLSPACGPAAASSALVRFLACCGSHRPSINSLCRSSCGSTSCSRPMPASGNAASEAPRPAPFNGRPSPELAPFCLLGAPWDSVLLLLLVRRTKRQRRAAAKWFRSLPAFPGLA